ncbi:TIR domain-containing protein [Rhizobium sp. OAE497]|uniref:cobaltochelatase CobT-related protein n=1 Tax=Rhizobium sp. OAE497 TaxID=2663796 RepID=UPI0018F6E34C
MSDPVAFLSYVRADDEHDHGRITALRHRLEGEVRMHTGRPFKIFQDKSDIQWGQQWKERLDSTLLNVTFLIPVVTPGYFTSSACRDEFQKFLLREKQLGENSLILPIYYFSAEQLENGDGDYFDDMGEILASRNWSDWRQLRFRPLGSEEVERAISDMAGRIKQATRDLGQVIKAAATTIEVKTETEAPEISKEIIDLSDFSPEIPTFVDFNASRSGRKHAPDSGYYAYTKEFDEEVSAEDLSDPAELRRLGKRFKTLVQSLENQHADLIRKIKAEMLLGSKAPFPSVALLIDNSGSMKGPKIEYTAAWSFIACKILEETGYQTEILGFTTRTWKGGQSREKWLTSGKPKSPGRLNDLRHIIYKDFSQSVLSSLSRVSLMTRVGLLKENIDGEAMLWAYNRIKEHGDRQSSIVVISDGAPVDDSTLASNKGDFLAKHLISTIEWLSRSEGVNVIGIGIDHDLSRYYKNTSHVEGASENGFEIIKALPLLLMAPEKTA